MSAIHIGIRVKKEFKKSGMTVSEFGRRINMSRENIYSIFRRKSIDTQLLETLSQVLKFDFFDLFHDKPLYAKEGKGVYITKSQLLQQEVKSLKRDLKNTQKQVEELNEKCELLIQLNKGLSEKAGK